MAIINKNPKARNITYFIPFITSKIEEYIIATINIKTKPNQSFIVCDIFGGADRDWTGTPLITLYDGRLAEYRKKHHPTPQKAAHTQAARDLGCIVYYIIDRKITANYLCNKNGQDKNEYKRI